MPLFGFRARDGSGREISGSRESADPPGLVASLMAEGYTGIVVWPLDATPPPEAAKSLSAEDTRELAQQLGGLARSGLPLPPGLRALAGKYSAFASTQAAWRFYANETVDVTHLVAPLHEYAHRCVEQEIDQVCLIADDWSEIDYDAHEAKDDRIELNSSKRLGYYLHSALLLSDRTGAPLVPLHASLWAADGIHTTRSPKVEPAHPHVDEVTQLMVATKQIGLARPCVYLIDRALDSVGHYRVWQRQQQMFVVRANARPRVAFAGRQMALSDVAEQVVMRPGEAVEISGSVTGQQFAGEAEVVITRAASHRHARCRKLCTR